MSEPVGVLLLSYGTPSRPEEIEAYYTHIRRGRAPTAEQVAELRARYDAIGGLSPLAERTRAQALGVQTALDAREPGRFRVVAAAKHAVPFIEHGVAWLAESGVRRAVALVLAPHYSALSVGEYFERVAAAADAAEPPLDVTYVRDWHVEPELIELLAERVRGAMNRFPPGAVVETLVTAHSLPARVLETRDPYPDQVRQTGTALAAAAGLTRWRVTWQSPGRTPEPWLGPDLLEVLPTIAAEGVDGVLVCPVGFTSDHLEVLYDVDVQARAVAESAGLQLERTPSLNDDPRFSELLARLVLDAVA
jgi:protoporphyrin/coproporphyrin ferrochelatase